MIEVLVLLLLLVLLAVWERKRAPKIGFCGVTEGWESPRVWHHFLSERECEYLKQYAEPLLERSQVMGETGNVVQQIRTSSQSWISKDNLIVKRIYARARNWAQLNTQVEDLQVARYLPNQEYKPHHDACCSEKPSCIKLKERLGLRNRTILIYLNDDFEGGGTIFPKLGITIKPQKGLAVMFHPLNGDETQCHPLALHGGLPVTSGEKWIANIWFRGKMAQRSHSNDKVCIDS